jgi:hypothetical protein
MPPAGPRKSRRERGQFPEQLSTWEICERSKKTNPKTTAHRLLPTPLLRFENLLRRLAAEGDRKRPASPQETRHHIRGSVGVLEISAGNLAALLQCPPNPVEEMKPACLYRISKQCVIPVPEQVRAPGPVQRPSSCIRNRRVSGCRTGLDLPARHALISQPGAGPTAAVPQHACPN